MARTFAYIYSRPRLSAALGLVVLWAIFNDDSCGKGHWR